MNKIIVFIFSLFVLFSACKNPENAFKANQIEENKIGFDKNGDFNIFDFYKYYHNKFVKDSIKKAKEGIEYGKEKTDSNLYGDYQFIPYNDTLIYVYKYNYVWEWCGTYSKDNDERRKKTMDKLDITPDSLKILKLKELNKFVRDNINNRKSEYGDFDRGLFFVIASPKNKLKGQFMDSVFSVLKRNNIKIYRFRKWTNEEKIVSDVKFLQKPYNPKKVNWDSVLSMKNYKNFYPSIY